MKTSVVVPIAIVAIAVAAGGGYWFGTKRADTAAKAAPAAAAPAAEKSATTAVAVEVVNVTTPSMPQMITAVGSLRSDESVTLRPEVAGRVVKIGFEEGRPV